ncbi:MAG: oxidoreductase [Aestuariivita sp.]|nr:oxidoreductase [Aestuariivita sp.]
MRRNIAIIGDNFMLPDVFEEKLITSIGPGHSIRKRQDNWPDEDLEHGYAETSIDGLKEYFGNADEIVDFVGQAEIFITHLAPMSRGMFEQLPNLKMLAVSRGGPVSIDMNAAKDHNVTVVNTPGRNASAVAEFTIGAILAESRNIRSGHEALRQGVYRGDLYRADTAGRELNEMTVGVIGYGKVGTLLVKILKAFGCHILVNDPFVQLAPEDIADGVEMVSFEEILHKSDVVTLHPRVTEVTKGMMNAEAFAKMKPDSIFVNTARGPLCDYDALYQALTTGQIGQAMLETFAIEPPPADWPLLKLPNVTLTPHIAGASMRTVTYAAEQVAEDVRRFNLGQPPKNQCF